MMEGNKATASSSRHQTPNDALIVPLCGLILTLWGGAHAVFLSASAGGIFYALLSFAGRQHHPQKNLGIAPNFVVDQSNETRLWKGTADWEALRTCCGTEVAAGSVRRS